MAFDRDAHHENLRQSKIRIAAALSNTGEYTSPYEIVSVLRARAHRILGKQHPGECNIDYFNRMADTAPRGKKSTTGNIVPARKDQPLRAKAWTPPRHPRAAEIDALPRQISMGGIGNGGGMGGREARD